MSLTPESIYWSNNVYFNLEAVKTCTLIEIDKTEELEDTGLMAIYPKPNPETGEAAEEPIMEVSKDEWDEKYAALTPNGFDVLFLCCYDDNTWHLSNYATGYISSTSHSASYFAAATSVLVRSFQNRIKRANAVRAQNEADRADPNIEVSDYDVEEFPYIAYIPRDPSGALATLNHDATWLEAYGYVFDPDKWLQLAEEGMEIEQIMDELSPIDSAEFVEAAHVVAFEGVGASTYMNNVPAMNDPFFIVANAPELCPHWVKAEFSNQYLRLHDYNSIPPSEMDRFELMRRTHGITDGEEGEDPEPKVGELVD